MYVVVYLMDTKLKEVATVRCRKCHLRHLEGVQLEKRSECHLLEIHRTFDFVQWRGKVIGITQTPPKDGAWSALFKNLSKSGLDNYISSKQGYALKNWVEGLSDELY